MLNRSFPLYAIVASGLVSLSGCATTSPSANRMTLPPAAENIPAPTAKTTIIVPDNEKQDYRSSELAQLRSVWQHAMRMDRKMAVKCVASMSAPKTSTASNSGWSSGKWVYRNGSYVRQSSQAPSTQPGGTADANHQACVDLSTALLRQSTRMMALSAPGAVIHYLFDAKAWAMECATFGVHDRECSGDTALSVLQREKVDASASLNLVDNQGNR